MKEFLRFNIKINVNLLLTYNWYNTTIITGQFVFNCFWLHICSQYLQHCYISNAINVMWYASLRWTHCCIYIYRPSITLPLLGILWDQISLFRFSNQKYIMTISWEMQVIQTLYWINSEICTFYEFILLNHHVNE